jgi:hypothetical protein
MPTDSNSAKPSILKNTREAKGLTLEIVHEATKIPMDALRAIEEGYSVRILSPFYYRGFIKIYAEFLGLDVVEMYKQYGLDQAPPKTTPVANTPVKSSRKVTVPSQPNVLLEQIQEWFSVVFKPKNLKLFAKIIAFLILFILLFKMGGCIISHFNKKSVAAKKQSAFNWQENKTQTHDDTDEQRAVPAAPVVKHESLQAQSQDNKVEVAVRASRNTYIQVKADGHVVFQTTLSKGSLESWSADDRIELSGRNIDQLDWEVNGKHIGSLGEGERRIRRVLITKQGLTVKK